MCTSSSTCTIWSNYHFLPLSHQSLQLCKILCSKWAGYTISKLVAWDVCAETSEGWVGENKRHTLVSDSDGLLWPVCLQFVFSFIFFLSAVSTTIRTLCRNIDVRERCVSWLWLCSILKWCLFMLWHVATEMAHCFYAMPVLILNNINYNTVRHLYIHINMNLLH